MHAARKSRWKLWLLVIVLLLVIAVLGFLCFRTFMGGGSSRSTTAASSGGLTTSVAAQDASGRDVSNSIAITTGTERPDIADENADLILLDIDWSAKREPKTPLILTVSNPGFTNDDGLSVYHCADGVWELLGTYRIADHAVSFRTDSLSPFAFEVISSSPTPTPAPTEEPKEIAEPTATPEPTAAPIDYGKYNHIQVGEFVETAELAADGAYVIVMLDEETAEQPAGEAAEPVTDGEAAEAFEAETDAEETAEPAGTDAPEADVTFFDATDMAVTLTGTVLLNYNGSDLHAIPAEIVRSATGVYTFTDPIVEGMIWTAVDSDTVSGTVRYTLANNDSYLNLDENDENVVLDDNATRTRWSFGAVTADGGESFGTLSYYDGGEVYYPTEMDMTASSDAEDGDVISFTVTTESGEARRMLLFRLKVNETPEPSATPEATANPDDDTTLVETTTPAPITGIDATPPPTATPGSSQIIIPVTPTAIPTATPGTTAPPPTTEPTAVPTTAPTAVPTTAPTATPNSGGAASSTDIVDYGDDSSTDA